MVDIVSMNYAALAEVLATSPAVVLALEAAAHDGKGYAESVAPVLTGDYKAAFVVSTGIENGLPVAALANTDFKAAWIEFGTSRSPARHILDHTLDHLRH